MKTLLYIVLFSIFALAINVPAALSFALMQRSFEENVKEADLIVIGTAISGRRRIEADADGYRYVAIRVGEILKGHGEANLELLVTPIEGIMENDPRCCKRGATYLLLLKKLGPARYEAVDGHFGVHEVR